MVTYIKFRFTTRHHQPRGDTWACDEISVSNVSAYNRCRWVRSTFCAQSRDSDMKFLKVENEKLGTPCKPLYS